MSSGPAVESCSERHQVQATDVLEMTPVEGGQSAATMAGSGGNDQIVVARHPSSSLGLGPYPRVFPRDLTRVGNDRQRREDRFQTPISSLAMVGGGPLHTVPQFGNRDGGDFDFLSREFLHPVRAIGGLIGRRALR